MSICLPRWAVLQKRTGQPRDFEFGRPWRLKTMRKCLIVLGRVEPFSHPNQVRHFRRKPLLGLGLRVSLGAYRFDWDHRPESLMPQGTFKICSKLVQN